VDKRKPRQLGGAPGRSTNQTKQQALTVLILLAALVALPTLLARAALLARLAGLLAWLLLPTTLLLARLTRFRVVLLLLARFLIRILNLLRHLPLLGGFSARRESTCRGRRSFRMERG
jgi:hypothetical protein